MRILVPTILVLAAAAPAQTTTACVHASTTSPSTGTCNVIPFGLTPTSTTWKNQKYQTLIPASLIGSRTGLVRELSFAACASGVQQFASIKVIMANTKAKTLSRTFANNLTGTNIVGLVTTVLDTTNYRWHVTANTWNRLGLQKPFLRIGSSSSGPNNVVIDIEVRGAGGTAGFHRTGTSGTTGVERSYAVGWTTKPPALASNPSASLAALHIQLCFDLADLSSYGVGCPGSNRLAPSLGFTGTPKIGQKITIDLGNAPAAGAAVFLAGFSNGAGLPVDLKIFNAPGCWLYVSPDLPIPAAISGGKSSLPFTVPGNKALVGTKLYGQFLVVDPTANRFGMTTSNYARALVGS